MSKKCVFPILVLMLSLCFAEAKTEAVKGVYSYKGESVKGLKAWVLGRQDTVRLDKKGRFRLKGVDCKNDTLVFESFKNQSIVVPLCGNTIVSVLRSDAKTDVELKKEQRRPNSVYGGNIYTKADLEQTGETALLKAIMVKSPQGSASSFLMNTTPLYFIDGAEVMAIDLPVKEVGYVEVVKATNSASSAFGVRGANGAILVTTEVKWKSMLGEE